MNGLTKRDSNCIKGIAIILMLFHHLFNEYAEYDGYAISYAPFSDARLTQLALMAKICVALFVFVSGYGLTRSFQAREAHGGLANIGDYLRFSLSRWWNLMTRYWFVFALYLICQPLGRTFVQAYGDPLSLDAWRYFFVDVLGLYFAAKTPPMNPTTWYLTLAIWFIFVVPLVNLTMKRFGTVQGALVWALLSVLIGWDDTYCHYMIVLLVGIVAARGSLFELFDERVRGLGARSVLALVLAAVAAVLMVLQWRNHQAFGLTEGLVALAVALICHLLLTETPLGLPLVFLGRHATNMFLTHTMLYSFYFLGFFFGFRYWWLVTAVLVVVSLVVSLAIELVEQKSGYDARMAHLGERLFGPAN